MHTLTNTTKVYMHHKLDKIVRGEMELLIEEESVLCTRCASLLNYIDRIEVELNMLTKVVLNCVRKKYGLGVMTADREHENFILGIKEQVYTGECESYTAVVIEQVSLAFCVDNYFFRKSCREARMQIKGI